MGGLLSGRWGAYENKTTVEDTWVLSVSCLQDALDAVTESGQERFACIERSLTKPNPFVLLAHIMPQSDLPVVGVRHSAMQWGGELIVCDYELRVSYTIPHYGGRRWWWVCPGVNDKAACGRRVQKLYLPKFCSDVQESHLACRHCHDLTYTSSQESHTQELLLASLRKQIAELYPDIDLSPLYGPEPYQG